MSGLPASIASRAGARDGDLVAAVVVDELRVDLVQHVVTEERPQVQVDRPALERDRSLGDLADAAVEVAGSERLERRDRSLLDALPGAFGLRAVRRQPDSAAHVGHHVGVLLGRSAIAPAVRARAERHVVPLALGREPQHVHRAAVEEPLEHSTRNSALSHTHSRLTTYSVELTRTMSPIRRP